MSILIAVVLGLIQGITEFLPVSSSGHVLVISRLLDSASSFEFDVLVSLGTLVAVLIYYRKRFSEIITYVFLRRDFRLALKLAAATVPAVAVGYIFKDIITLYLHGMVTAIVMLLVIGAVMVWSAGWKPKKQLPVNKDLHEITYVQAITIGAAQCLALVSGSSRSGVTMLAALKQGITVKTAAEWSFLMSVPVIAGAMLRVLITDQGLKFVTEQTAVFVVANVISFVSGIAAIHILLKILQKKGLYWFGWYRIVLAIVLILLGSVKLL